MDKFQTQKVGEIDIRSSMLDSRFSIFAHHKFLPPVEMAFSIYIL